jgi:hypothetical protein
LAPLVLVAVAVLAAEVRLVHFHHAREREGVALHRRAPAVAHVPASVVVGARLLTEHNPVDLQRADALLRGEHEVADLEPEPQPDLGVLEDRAGDDREAVAVPTAALGVLAKPVEGPRLEGVDLLLGPAAGAAHAVRPPLAGQVVLARLVGGELPVEAIEGLHGPEGSLSEGGCQ